MTDMLVRHDQTQEVTESEASTTESPNVVESVNSRSIREFMQRVIDVTPDDWLRATHHEIWADQIDPANVIGSAHINAAPFTQDEFTPVLATVLETAMFDDRNLRPEMMDIAQKFGRSIVSSEGYTGSDPAVILV